MESETEYGDIMSPPASTTLLTKTGVPSSKFTIQILNFSDDEKISYNLILLKGCVYSRDQDLVNGCVSVHTCDKVGRWPVNGGHFRSLIHLSKGQNVIRLSYEDCSLNIRLEYAPRVTELYVVPLYIICSDHDGQFQGPEKCDCSVESALKRISVGAKLLQSIVADKLSEAGLGRYTFQLKNGGECIVHKSPLSVEEAHSMKSVELWEYFGRELINTWGIEESQNCKFLAFLGCTKYFGSSRSKDLTHEEVLAKTKGYVALGGGGLALFGTACLHTWPSSELEVLGCLHDDTPVDQRRLMDDSCYRGTYGGCFSTTLGSVLHELCHTFDLGHTTKGVMGRGFDRMDLVFGAMLEKPPYEIIKRNPSAEHQSVDFTMNLSVDVVAKSKKSDGAVSPIEWGTSQKRKPKALPQNSDLTFFTESCSFMLAYHRWFNDKYETTGCGLQFDERSWTLRSGVGLRVVEVRCGERQEVCASWCLRPARQLYSIPRSAISASSKPPLLLVAEDSAGRILRHTLTL